MVSEPPRIDADDLATIGVVPDWKRDETGA
jgi:hypothetical protein